MLESLKSRIIAPMVGILTGAVRVNEKTEKYCILNAY